MDEGPGVDEEALREVPKDWAAEESSSSCLTGMLLSNTSFEDGVDRDCYAKYKARGQIMIGLDSQQQASSTGLVHV